MRNRAVEDKVEDEERGTRLRRRHRKQEEQKKRTARRKDREGETKERLVKTDGGTESRSGRRKRREYERKALR